MKKHQFFSAYERYDCDPADCSDFRADTLDYDSETAEEFEEAERLDSESGVDSSFGVDSAEQDEQAAARDADTDIGGLYEISESYDSTDADGADETQTQSDVADPSDGNGICVNPEDETAATCDDCNCTESDNCGEWDCRTAKAQAECSLDDYEIISDVLGGEKQLVKLYSTALCESTEDTLRDVIRANLTEAAKDQYETFEYMQKRGLYPTEEADEQEIWQAKQQFGKLCK